MFHGYDNDQTMVRIGAMNLLLHGIEQPDLVRQDSLSEPLPDTPGLESEKFSLILANPPFSGSLDGDTVAADLQRVVNTKKTELLFLAAMLKLLKVGGRAAVIVPDGVLFGSTAAHKTLRKLLVENHKLDGVIKLPSGVFKPYAGVSTAILLFTKTNSGGTENVWFYDVLSDGFSLDDKRQPVSENDVPDVLARWQNRDASEIQRTRKDQSFCVSKEEIAAANYDLSMYTYREMTFEAVEHRLPLEILSELEDTHLEILSGIEKLKDLLK
jgi:type I restriction enzyme M protein